MQTAKTRKYPVPHIDQVSCEKLETVHNDPFEVKKITIIHPR